MSTLTHFSEPFVQVSMSKPLSLESGDCLTREEFERRYEAMPDVHQAELIDGVVYMPSPVKLPHAGGHGLMLGWLFTYASRIPDVQCLACGSVRIDDENEVQPDAYLRRTRNGQSSVDEDDYIIGAPELIVEVASSSVSRDLHQKLRLYERIGVREYLVWRVLENAIDWFHLEDGSYRPLTIGDDKTFRSREFPGLWLDALALVKGDIPAVMARLSQGLESPEHREFAARLAAAQPS